MNVIHFEKEKRSINFRFIINDWLVVVHVRACLLSQEAGWMNGGGLESSGSVRQCGQTSAGVSRRQKVNATEQVSLELEG